MIKCTNKKTKIDCRRKREGMEEGMDGRKYRWKMVGKECIWRRLGMDCVQWRVGMEDKIGI